MRRFQSMRWFRFPWLRRETAQTETSPLIPKTDTDRELSGVLQGSEDSSTEEQAPEPGPNDGPENQGRTREVEPRAHSRPFSLSDCLLKYLLFFSNLLFTVLGLLVLALGLWGLINKESFAQEKGQISTDPMLVFVMLGLVLSTLCLLQGQIEGYLRSGMLAAMVRYQDDLDLRFITDEIQIGLQCCGANNYRDWQVNMYYNGGVIQALS
ncbi:tetraspanin-10-like [Coregonus clupeaformis]|uniref:tetraspanin-10-like n=1 Tax=Coregonus clupeaformis TaxID=59861 RepID=UPI001E1C43F9|nr:tetraspanin-10-like [Coregonus clupeaformis]